jgi:transcription initiation factor TFIIIB Brf1 subunit/transcription initiation factor TFIIB
MYSARDRVEHTDWLDRIEAAADEIDVGQQARSTAGELFLTHIPEADRSKQAVAAASLYAGTLIAGEERSQQAVADAMDVSRLSVQSRWKPLLEDAGFDPPTW